MRIWLIVPPRPQVLNLLPPYPLGYLAAACRRSGHEPRILDCVLERHDTEALVRGIAAGRPDVVGLTMFSSDFATVSQVCRRIKQLPQPPVIILGGIHPSCFPEATLAAIPETDFVFSGEAEVGLPALLDVLAQPLRPKSAALAAIPGLGWRAGGRTRNNGTARISDLDRLEPPAWDLLQPLRYQRFPPTLLVRQRPFAPLITTRGCPHRCTFCAGHTVSGHRVRSRPLDAVFAEIGYLRARYGIRELHIEDDNFTWRRERVQAFCEGLLRRRWNLTWTLPNGVRLDTLDLDLLRLMKRAGCYLLILGVESGSDRILQHMQKKISVRQVEEKVELVRRSGILPHAFFMLGYPAETPADIQATLKLALRLPLIGAHFSSYRPLPGTHSSEVLMRRGEIQASDLVSKKSTFASVVYAPRGMTLAQIKAWQKKMLKAFYFRPRILWFYAREMFRHPGLLVNLARRAWVYLGS